MSSITEDDFDAGRRIRLTVARQPAEHSANHSLQLVHVHSVLYFLTLLFCQLCGCVSNTNQVSISSDWIVQTLANPAQLPETQSLKEERGHTSWHLSASPGEALGKSFVVRLASSTSDDLSFDISTLSNADAVIDSAHAQIYSVETVKITHWPGWHIRSIEPSERHAIVPDVLVPIGAPGSDFADGLEAEIAHYFWLDISVPRDTTPGDYVGTLQLHDGSDTLFTIDINLTVWPFLLPKSTRPTFIVDVDHTALISHHIQRNGRPLHIQMDDWSGYADAERITRLLQQTMILLRHHGLNPVMSALSPPIKITSGNEVVPQWSHYKSVILPMLNGTLFKDEGGLTRWPIPTKPLVSLGVGTATRHPLSETLALNYTKQCIKEFGQWGILSRSYLLVDDFSTSHTLDYTHYPIAHETLSSDPRLHIMHYGVPQDLRPYGWVDYNPSTSFTDSEGWLIPGQFFDPSTTEALRKKGKKTWLHIDRPPFTGTLDIAAPPAYARVIAWQSLSLEADTVFLGQACPWPSADADVSPQACIEFDSRSLLYPGQPFGVDHPLASMRLKYLRQGIQDIGYGELLRQHHLGHIERSIRQAICVRAGTQAYRTHYADGLAIGWSADWRDFDAGRDIFVEALSHKSSKMRPAARDTVLSQNVRWRKLMDKRRRIDIQCDGTRIRLVGDTMSPTLEIISSVSISNQSRTTIQGSLSYESVPVSWASMQPTMLRDDIAPMTSSRVQLSALCPLSKISFHENQRIQITLDTEDGKAITTHARASIVAASFTPSPIEIDGRLDDWRDSAANVLSDFQLISPQPSNISHSGKPTSRTLAFVKCDESYLYIAIRSDFTDEIIDRGPRRNRIDYDDMIPTGSELIEILIDPLNAGTRSVTDLYHIVIMKDGGDYAEMGIRLDPPCGRSTPWAVNIRTATSLSDNHWIAEVAIPLSAFGPAATDHTIWGFNVTRFDQAHQEFSTWSGAQLNAYDPLSLGNLLLP